MGLRVSFPGRYGDLLWAMPTVRAMAEHLGQPCDLFIAGEFESIAPLLLQQEYIHTVEVLRGWTGTNWQAPTDAEHLGYRRWPELPLPYEVAKQAGVEIDLTRPWITATPFSTPSELIIGFTEAWFELKVGLLEIFSDCIPAWLVRLQMGLTVQLCPTHSRWSTTWRHNKGIYETDWLASAAFLSGAKLFFGDCSALHVLACAMGVPALLMEPMEARWNPIFYPYGMDGPQVTVIKGLDGRPTFDVRHCADALIRRIYG